MIRNATSRFIRRARHQALHLLHRAIATSIPGLLLFGIANLPASAWADPPKTTTPPTKAITTAEAQAERLAAFLNTSLYQQLILSQWQRQSMTLCGEPSQPGLLRHVGLSLHEEISFRDGKPFEGVWADRYRGQACGRERQFNFLFTARQGKLVVRHMLPGRTLAPPRLQLDAMNATLPRLMARHPACTSFVPLNSELERTPGNVDAPWSEIWTFEACGRLAAVRVTFTPDGKGGTFFQVE